MYRPFSLKQGLIPLLLTVMLMRVEAQNPDPYDDQPADFGNPGGNPDPFDEEPEDFDPPAAPIDDYLWIATLGGIAIGGYYFISKQSKRPSRS